MPTVNQLRQIAGLTFARFASAKDNAKAVSINQQIAKLVDVHKTLQLKVAGLTSYLDKLDNYKDIEVQDKKIEHWLREFYTTIQQSEGLIFSFDKSSVINHNYGKYNDQDIFIKTTGLKRDEKSAEEIWGVANKEELLNGKEKLTKILKNYTEAHQKLDQNLAVMSQIIKKIFNSRASEVGDKFQRLYGDYHHLSEIQKTHNLTIHPPTPTLTEPQTFQLSKTTQIPSTGSGGGGGGGASKEAPASSQYTSGIQLKTTGILLSDGTPIEQAFFVEKKIKFTQITQETLFEHFEELHTFIQQKLTEFKNETEAFKTAVITKLNEKIDSQIRTYNTELAKITPEKLTTFDATVRKYLEIAGLNSTCSLDGDLNLTKTNTPGDAGSENLESLEKCLLGLNNFLALCKVYLESNQQNMGFFQLLQSLIDESNLRSGETITKALAALEGLTGAEGGAFRASIQALDADLEARDPFSFDSKTLQFSLKQDSEVGELSADNISLVTRLTGFISRRNVLITEILDYAKYQKRQARVRAVSSAFCGEDVNGDNSPYKKGRLTQLMGLSPSQALLRLNSESEEQLLTRSVLVARKLVNAFSAADAPVQSGGASKAGGASPVESLDLDDIGSLQQKYKEAFARAQALYDLSSRKTMDYGIFLDEDRGKFESIDDDINKQGDLLKNAEALQYFTVALNDWSKVLLAKLEFSKTLFNDAISKLYKTEELPKKLKALVFKVKNKFDILGSEDKKWSENYNDFVESLNALVLALKTERNLPLTELDALESFTLRCEGTNLNDDSKKFFIYAGCSYFQQKMMLLHGMSFDFERDRDTSKIWTNFNNEARSQIGDLRKESLGASARLQGRLHKRQLSTAGQDEQKYDDNPGFGSDTGGGGGGGGAATPVYTTPQKRGGQVTSSTPGDLVKIRGNFEQESGKFAVTVEQLRRESCLKLQGRLSSRRDSLARTQKQRAMASLNERLNELEVEKERLIKALAETKKQLKEKTGEVEKLTADMALITAQIGKLEEENRQIQLKNEELESENERLGKNLEWLDTANSELTKQHEVIAKQIKELFKQLEAKKEELLNLKAERSAIQKVLDQQEVVINELSAEKKDLADKLKDSENDNDNIWAQKEKIQLELNRLRQRSGGGGATDSGSVSGEDDRGERRSQHRLKSRSLSQSGNDAIEKLEADKKSLMDLYEEKRKFNEKRITDLLENIHLLNDEQAKRFTIDDIQEQVHELVEYFKRQISSNEIKINELIENLKEKDAEIININEQLQIAATKGEDLIKRLETATAEKKQIEQELAQLRETNAASTTKIEALLKQIDEITQEKTQAAEVHSIALEAARREAQTELQALQARLEGEQRNHAERLAQYQAEAVQQQQRFTEQEKKLQAELKKTQDEKKEIETALAKVESEQRLLIEQQKNKEAEIEGLQKKSGENAALLTKHEAELSDLKTQNEANLAKIAELEQKKAEFGKKEKALESELHTLRQSLETAKREHEVALAQKQAESLANTERLTNELAEVRREHAKETEKYQQQLQTQKLELEAKLNASTEEKQKNNQSLVQTQSELRHLKEQLEQNQVLIEALKKQKIVLEAQSKEDENVKAELLEVKDKLKTLEEKLQTQQNKIKGLQQANTLLESKKDEYEATILRLTTELAETKQNLQSARQSNATMRLEYAARVAQTNVRAKSLSKKIDAEKLQTELAEEMVKKQLEEAQDKLKLEYEEALAELESTRKKLKNLALGAQQYQTENNDLKNRIEAQKLKHKATLEELLEQSERVLQKKESEEDVLKNKLERLKGVPDKVKEVTLQREALIAEKEKLEENLTRAQQEHQAAVQAAAQAHAAALLQLQEGVKATHAENVGLQESISRQQINIGQLTEQLETAKRDSAVKTQESQRLTTQIAGLNAKISEYEDEIQKLKDDYRALEKTKDEKERELSRLTTDEQKKLEELRTLKASLEEERNKAAGSEQRITILTGRINELETQLSESEGKIKDAHSKLQQLEKVLAETKGSTQQQIQALEAEKAQLNALIGTKEDELKVKIAELEQVNQVNAGLEATLAGEKQKYTEQQALFEQSQASVEAQGLELKQLQDRLRAAKEQYRAELTEQQEVDKQKAIKLRQQYDIALQGEEIKATKILGTRLNSQKKSLKAEFDAKMNQLLAEHKAEITRLREEHAAELEKLRVQYGALETQSQVQRQEITALKESHAQAIAKIEATHEAKLEELTQAHEQSQTVLTQEIDGLTTKSSEAQVNLGRIRGQFEEESRAKVELTEVVGRITAEKATQEQRLAELNHQKESLVAEFKAKNEQLLAKHQAEITRLREEHAAELDALRAQYGSLEKLNQAQEHAKNQLTKSHAQAISEIQATHAAELRELTLAHEQNQTELTQEIEGLRVEYTESQGNLGRIRGQFEATNQTNAQLRGDIGRITAEKADQEQRLAQLTAELQKASQKAAGQVRVMAALRAENDEKVKENATLQQKQINFEAIKTQLKEKTGELKATVAKIAGIEASLAELKRDNETKTVENSRLQKELQTARETEAGLRKEIETLKAQLLVEHGKVRESAKKSLAEKLEESVARLGELQGRLEMEEMEVTRLRAELKKLQTSQSGGGGGAAAAQVALPPALGAVGVVVRQSRRGVTGAREGLKGSSLPAPHFT